MPTECEKAFESFQLSTRTLYSRMADIERQAFEAGWQAYQQHLREIEVSQEAMCELKPCPFCGSDAGLMAAHRVSCSQCHAEGPGCNSDAEAIAAWNSRPSPLGERLLKVLLADAEISVSEGTPKTGPSVARYRTHLVPVIEVEATGPTPEAALQKLIEKLEAHWRPDYED